jgi:predicted N-formylglutamate amidohydrolase
MAQTADKGETFPATVENRGGAGRIVLCCEHASNHFPATWGDLGLSVEQRLAHIAWDPGALALSRLLSASLNAPLVHAPVSRLIYDLNRPPFSAGAMPARSEIHDVPGNATISAQERAARMRAIYLPFHSALHDLLAERMALGLDPVLVTIHSFTPLYFGKRREVEFGVIHDDDPRLARAIVKAAASTGLRTGLNEPYSAGDGVTHTLKLQATPYGLPHAMLEIRNDLIHDAAGVQRMANLLVPVLNMGLAEIQRQAKAS